MRRGEGAVSGRIGGRRAGSVAVGLLALAIGAAGCSGSSGDGSASGSSGSSPSTTSASASGGASASPSTSASGGGSSGPLTKDQAETLAKTINLTRSDLPGYRATPSSKDDSGDQAASDRLNRCAGGVPDSKDIAREDSPDFTAGAGGQIRQVSSSVSVLPSAALAAKDLAAVKSARGRSCFRSFVNAVLAKAGNGQVRFSKAHVTAFQPSTDGTDGAFGYRVTVAARSDATRIPFYVDGLGFTKGPVEVSLTTLSIGRRFPAADEQKLFAMLASRAQGQPS